MRLDPSEIRLDDYRRILVCGPTGSGKTTLAQQIATRLEIPCVEMDALFWEPGWKGAPDEVFFGRLSDATQGEEWVVDGNYTRTRHITLPRTQLAIWLHFPFGWTFGRLLSRTVSRCRNHTELWPGCRENWRTMFSRESILLWLLQSHGRNGRQLRDCEANPGWAHVDLISFRKPRELEAWHRAQGLYS